MSGGVCEKMEWKDVEGEMRERCLLLNSRIAIEREGTDFVKEEKDRDVDRDDLRLEKRYPESYKTREK